MVTRQAFCIFPFYNKSYVVYWLVETEEQLEEFKQQQYQKVFVEVIPFDNREHPYENEICAVYIFPLNSQKGFILPISHSETLSLRLSEIERVLSEFKAIYVRDKKEFMHYFLLKALYNTPLPPQYVYTINTST